MDIKTTHTATSSRALEFLNEWIEHQFNPWFSSLLSSIPRANTLQELIDTPHRSAVNKVIVALNIAAQYACHRKSQPYSYNLTSQEFEELMNSVKRVNKDAALRVQMDYISRLEKVGYGDSVVPYTINTSNYGGVNASSYNWNGKNYDVSFNIFPKIRTESGARTGFPPGGTRQVTTTTKGATRKNCGWFCRAWKTVRSVINVVVPGGSIATGVIDIILDLLDIMEIENQKGAFLDLSPNVEVAAQLWFENKFMPFYKKIALSLGNPTSKAQVIDSAYVRRINSSIGEFQIARFWYNSQRNKTNIIGLSPSEKEEYFDAIDKMLSDAANGIATKYASLLRSYNYNKLSLGNISINPTLSKGSGIENYLWTSKGGIVYKGFVGNFTIGGGSSDVPTDGGGNSGGGTATGGTVLDGPSDNSDHDVPFGGGDLDTPITSGSSDTSKTKVWPWLLGGALIWKITRNN